MGQMADRWKDGHISKVFSFNHFWAIHHSTNTGIWDMLAQTFQIFKPPAKPILRLVGNHQTLQVTWGICVVQPSNRRGKNPFTATVIQCRPVQVYFNCIGAPKLRHYRCLHNPRLSTISRRLKAAACFSARFSAAE